MLLKLSAVKFVLQLGCFSPLDSTTEVFVLVMVDQFAFVKSWSYAQWRKLSLSKGALFHSFFSDHNLEMWNVFYQKILSQNWPQQQFHMYVCVWLYVLILAFHYLISWPILTPLTLIIIILSLDISIYI